MRFVSVLPYNNEMFLGITTAKHLPLCPTGFCATLWQGEDWKCQPVLACRVPMLVHSILNSKESFVYLCQGHSSVRGQPHAATARQGDRNCLSQGLQNGASPHLLGQDLCCLSLKPVSSKIGLEGLSKVYTGISLLPSLGAGLHGSCGVR